VLIEDDAICITVQYNLDKEGFRVIGSETARRARLCRREHPDLVILDIMLPDSDASNLQRIRSNSRFGEYFGHFFNGTWSETDDRVWSWARTLYRQASVDA